MTDARSALFSGKARALVSMEDRRHPRFPDVPTVVEALGRPWHVAHWRGLVAPKGLPAALTDKFVSGLRKVADDADFRREAAASAFTVRWRFGEDFAQYMDEDDRQFGRVIRLLDEEKKSCAH